MVTADEARAQLEARKQEIARAQSSIQARQQALPETRTQRALQTLRGITGALTRTRVGAQREQLQSQAQEIQGYSKEVQKVEGQISGVEQSKMIAQQKQKAYEQARHMYLAGEDISKAQGYTKDYLKQMIREGTLFKEAQDRAMAKDLESQGFNPMYSNGKLIGFEDPYAEMSVPIQSLKKHLERYETSADIPQVKAEVAYKDIITGDITSTIPDSTPSARQVPVAVSSSGVQLGGIEQIRAAGQTVPIRNIQDQWAAQAVPKKTILERAKELPGKAWESISGKTGRETYAYFFEGGEPAVREGGVRTGQSPYRPVTTTRFAKDVGGTAIGVVSAARKSLWAGSEYLSEKLPAYGPPTGDISKFREVGEVQPVKERSVFEKAAGLPGKAWQAVSGRTPKETYEFLGTKEVVKYGAPVAAELYVTKSIPTKLVAPAITGAGAVTVVGATKDIRELEAQKIDVKDMQKEIGEKPAGVLPEDWKRYKDEYQAEIDRYNKEIDDAIKEQRKSQILGGVGVGVGVGIGAMAGARAASRFLRTEVVKEVPLPLAKPKAVVVQKIVDIKGKPKVVSALEVRGEVSPWILRTKTTRGAQIKDFFGRNLEKVVKVGDKPMVSMRSPPKVDFIPSRPFIIRTTAPAVEGEIFTTAEAVAGRRQLKISRAFDSSRKTSFKEGAFLRGAKGEKLPAQRVREIEEFLRTKLPAKESGIRLYDPSKMRTSFGLSKDISKVRVTPRTFTDRPLTSPVEGTLAVSDIANIAKSKGADVFGIKTVSKRISSAAPKRAGRVQELDTTLIRLKDKLPASKLDVVGDVKISPSTPGEPQSAKRLALREEKRLKSIADLIELPKPVIPKPSTRVIPPELSKSRTQMITKTISPQITSYSDMVMAERGAKKPSRVEVVKAKETKLKFKDVSVSGRSKVTLSRDRKDFQSRTKKMLIPALMDITIDRSAFKSVSKSDFESKSTSKQAFRSVELFGRPTYSTLVTPKVPSPTRPTRPTRPTKGPKSKTPIIPIPVIPKSEPKKIFRESMPRARAKPGYEVEVKRGGRWVDVTPFAISEGEALALGRRETKAGAEVSFRLKEAGDIGGTLNLAPISRAELKSEYRGRIVKGKEVKAPLTFIQKRKSRISTKGELSAITAKGIEKRKSQAGGIKWI